VKDKNRIVVPAAIPATATVESEPVDAIALGVAVTVVIVSLRLEKEEEGDDEDDDDDDGDDVDVDVDIVVALAMELAMEKMTAIADGAVSSQVSFVGLLQSTMPLVTLQQAHFCVVLLYTMSGV